MRRGEAKLTFSGESVDNGELDTLVRIVYTATEQVSRVVILCLVQ